MQRSSESSVGGPQRRGIKPCDLHEIAPYLCGARTKTEAERVFFPGGEENWREEGENEGISIPPKGEGRSRRVTYHQQ